MKLLINVLLLCWSTFAFAVPTWNFELKSKQTSGQDQTLLTHISIQQNVLTLYSNQKMNKMNKMIIAFVELLEELPVNIDAMMSDHDKFNHFDDTTNHIHFALKQNFISPELFEKISGTFNLSKNLHSKIVSSYSKYFMANLHTIESSLPLGLDPQGFSSIGKQLCIAACFVIPATIGALYLMLFQIRTLQRNLQKNSIKKR